MGFGLEEALGNKEKPALLVSLEQPRSAEEVLASWEGAAEEPLSSRKSQVWVRARMWKNS